MLTSIILNILFFSIYYMPNFGTFHHFMVFCLLLTLLSTVASVFIFYKVMYIFNFIFLFFFLFLHFHFNQFIGFFFLIEISTALFILAVIVELRLNYKKYSNKKEELYCYILFFIFYVSTSEQRFKFFDYLNYFDNFASEYYLVNQNSLLGVYNLFFDFKNFFVFIMSWSFVLVTYVIIFFYKKWKTKKTLKNGFSKNIYKTASVLDKKDCIKNVKMDWYDRKCKNLNHDKALDLVLDYRNYDRYKFK